MKKQVKILIMIVTIPLVIVVAVAFTLLFKEIKRVNENHAIIVEEGARRMAFEGEWTRKKFIEDIKQMPIYYDSVERALAEYEQKDNIKIEMEIHRFMGKEAIVFVHLVKKDRSIQSSHEIMFIKDNKFYRPHSVTLSMGLVDGYKMSKFKQEYTEADKIAGFIDKGFFTDYILSYANDGKPIYYGIAENDNIYNLRILDNEPTGIMPFEYDGKTYYYWYYEGISFMEEIRGQVDYLNIGPKDIVEKLDIRFHK